MRSRSRKHTDKNVLMKLFDEIKEIDKKMFKYKKASVALNFLPDKTCHNFKVLKSEFPEGPSIYGF